MTGGVTVTRSSITQHTISDQNTKYPDDNALTLRVNSAQPATVERRAAGREGFDREALLHRLAHKLPDLKRVGSDLVAPCPSCGGVDRFFSGRNVGYRVFHCRQCGHSVSTTTLLGLAFTPTANPAVKPWVEQATQPGRVDAVREVYASLATFAQCHLITPRAIEALTQRGLINPQLSLIESDTNLDLVRRAGIGYLDATLYREWHQSLDAGQRVACEWAGLPSGDRERLTGHGAMFAGGHLGKIVFPYIDDWGNVQDTRTRSISNKDTVGGKQVRYTSPKGSMDERGAAIPYGVHLLPERGPVLLTEGEFKALAANLLAGVACLGLRGISDWRDDYLDYLRGRLVILAFDNDANGAGNLATVQIGRRLAAQHIDLMILPPAKLGRSKGIDDYILAEGGAAFATLAQPQHLVTLSEFETALTAAGVDLSKLKTPRADVGTVRRWTPEDHVNTHAHPHAPTVTVDEATAIIADAVNDHLANWKQGHKQLLITAVAGVGKTHTTIQETLTHAHANSKTVAVILPNHDTIDEKIADGTLAGFRHIYGHNADNCKLADEAKALTSKGYSPGQVLCPTCPFAGWCKKDGYKSQFVTPDNRAYVHAHAFTGYPEGEDIVIADELGHKIFVDSMRVSINDLASALEQGGMPAAQRALLSGLMAMWTAPGLADVEGAAFYAVLERFAPGLRDVDAWGDGSHVQGALFDAATAFVNGEGNASAEKLPQQFGLRLIALLSEDVRRLNAGQRVTGRVRFVSLTSRAKWLELTYSRAPLPAWFLRRPTIILNATADAEIMQDLCGSLRVVAPQVAVAAGNEIVQDVAFNNAKSAYLGSSEGSEARRRAWLEGIRTHVSAHAGGEVDTTIIVAKRLAPYVTAAFPAAKVAHYHALEGRNDLQSGLTILASAVPVDINAVLREASALYPGIDTTLTRSTVAFDQSNDGGELLAVEQIDACDRRVAALIAQHRDAAAVQAVHRARLVRQSGRRVVVMFSRPIPGLRPSTTITDRPTGEDKRSQQKAARLANLLAIATELVAESGGFTVDLLSAATSYSVNTVRDYLPDLCLAGGWNRLVLPVLQPLANGGHRQREMGLVIAKEVVAEIRQIAKMHVDQQRNNKDLITTLIHVHLGKFLPSTWGIDVDALMDTTTPAAPQPTAPGRWAAARDALALKAELLKARQGSPEKQWAAKVLISFLNSSNDDQSAARGALYEMGLPYAVRWELLTT